MEQWQKLLIIVYGLVSLVVFVKGYIETKNNKNAFGLTNYLNFLGIICWGDAVVFGIFWTVTSIVSLSLSDFYLFCLVISVFWVVRSLGETIYWFNQQFSTIDRNPLENLNKYYVKVFHNDSVWFAYQIIWQCVTVVSIISAIYFTKLWIDYRF